jgi:DNA-binding NtrC family response regulator
MHESLPRVLCVDDEPNVLSAHRRALRGRFEIALAACGADALRTLEDEGPFAVIVSDLHMPGMNGIRLLAQVQERWPEVMRILLSGYGDTVASDCNLNVDAVFRCLAKPLPQDALCSAIDAAVCAKSAIARL